MEPVVTLTMNPAIDTSSAVEHVVPDRKLRCKAPRHDPGGGGGINVSRALSRLGADSLAVYPAGGPTGVLLHDLLEKEGIRQYQVPIAAWTRENLYVLEEATRHQYRFIMPGSRLADDEWQRCLQIVEGLPETPAYIVASGSLPPGVPNDFFARLGRLASSGMGCSHGFASVVGAFTATTGQEAFPATRKKQLQCRSAARC
jgi:6-phosphofructokinase 2